MNAWVEPNDHLSTVKMWHYDSDTGTGAATFYDNDGCSGRQGRLWSGEINVPRGYNFDDMWENNVANDAMNAVRIPLGYTVEFYDHPNFRNLFMTMQGSINEWGMLNCQNLNDVRDRASSIVVKKEPSRMAQGKWIQVGSGRATYKFSYGFSYDTLEMSAAASQSTLSTQMSVGIKFSPKAGVTQTISNEHRQFAAEGATSMFSVSGEATYETYCPDPWDPLDNAVGYWVFSVTSHDGSIVSQNKGGICRYGEGYWNVSPECPFSACVNGDCTTCRDWEG